MIIEENLEITDFVNKITQEYKNRDIKYKSNLGQYFTPFEIVSYILDQIDTSKLYKCLLDPAAGLGNLLIPVIEYLVTTNPELYKDETIQAYLFEIDKSLINDLKKGMLKLAEKLREKYHVLLKYNIICGDFLEIYKSSIKIKTKLLGRSEETSLLDFFDPFPELKYPISFDLIILNPPYGKINTTDPRSNFIKWYTYGHTNLYSAFLGYCKILSKFEGGIIIAIVPRSFCNGIYFRKFRARFLDNNWIKIIGSINQRDRVFSDQKVLQENIIIFTVTTSTTSLSNYTNIHIIDHEITNDNPPYEYNLYVRDNIELTRSELLTKIDKVIRIPSNQHEFSVLKHPILKAVQFSELGFRISTGQLVQHRSREYLINGESKTQKTINQRIKSDKPVDHFPLILGSHIFPNELKFPRDNLNGKTQFINKSYDLKYPNYIMKKSFYIVLRRFSVKDEKRRIVAALITPEDFNLYNGFIFDNKINYISIPENYSHEEQYILAKGLLNYISSVYFDRAFRLISGNTQVNASDFNLVEFPNKDQLLSLGSLSFSDKSTINHYIDVYRGKNEMGKQNNFEELIQEAIKIIKELELPYTISEEKAAIILICLADIEKPGEWKNADNLAHTPNENRPIDPIRKVKFHGIQKEALEKFDYRFPDREEIRRKALHHWDAVGFVIYNQDKPDRNKPNSTKNNYRLSDKVKEGLNKYNTKDWVDFVEEFKADKQRIEDALHRKIVRKTVRISFKDRFGNDIEYHASKGKHSEIEKAIVTQFPQFFIKNPTTVLYLDDTASGEYRDDTRLEELGIKLDPKGKLPDVILYDEVREWLFLFEAVESHGPIDDTRLKQLTDLFPNHQGKLIFITAFNTLKSFGKSTHRIAFDTEIWVADKPDHLIHYNGDRFLGPREIRKDDTFTEK